MHKCLYCCEIIDDELIFCDECHEYVFICDNCKEPSYYKDGYYSIGDKKYCHICVKDDPSLINKLY